MDLAQRSTDIILENQNADGAYIASPAFANYRYCWVRDGSFIAYAMLRGGRMESCERFLGWMDRAICRQASRIETIVRKRSNGLRLAPGEHLPTRYLMDGSEASDGWPTFQIDGYGTWLWLIGEYARSRGSATVLRTYGDSIRLTLDYLEAVWDLPNYDCWEENGHAMHTSTLACVCGGMAAANRLLADRELARLTEAVRKKLLGQVVEGRFRKHSESASVDASLLWLAVPFGVVDARDQRMALTVRAIEELLLEGGGVRRYPEDTYYGGGLWLLLGCWLGWYRVRVGEREKAEDILRWVEAQADEQGNLPEQVAGTRTDARFRREWEEKWGSIACPLLWSHAAYLVLRREIAEGGGGASPAPGAYSNLETEERRQ